MKNEKQAPALDEMYNGICDVTYYKDGAVSGLRFCEKNWILTHAGQLIPYYSEDSPRRKYKASVTFHPDGALKAVSLDAQQEVVTPIGEMPAELVTFYDTGELKRVFPLDGKISGYWSETDERGLNSPFHFEFDFTAFKAMLSGLCFYKSGSIKSVTLFPQEIIKVSLGPGGALDVRQGFSLYEDGRLESLEPAQPAKLETPVGILTAYDPNASGVNADKNSLRLDGQGRIAGLVTAGDRIHVFRKSDGKSFAFQPKIVYADDEAAELLTLTVGFDYDSRAVTVTDTDGTATSFDFNDTFVVYNNAMPALGCSGGDCSNCSLCGK
jgi:hypothetical protein